MDIEILESKQELVAEREIKIYSTDGTKKSIRSSAKTWGALQNELGEINVRSSGMKVMTSDRTTLEDGGARIPNHDFVLFLTPKKTKSGMDVDAASYSECRAKIKSILDGTGDPKNRDTAEYVHFNSGKNYTTKGTAILKTLLKAWFANNASEVKEEKPETFNAENIEKAPEPKVQAKLIKVPAEEKVKVNLNNLVRENLDIICEVLGKLGKQVSGTPNLLIVNAINNLNIASQELKSHETTWDKVEEIAKELGMDYEDRW